MTDQEKQRIAVMRSLGESYNKIAIELNLSANTVKTFCRRNKLTGVRAAVSVPEDLSAMPATQSLISGPDGGNSTDTEKPESVEKPGDSRKRKTFTVKLEFAEHDDETAVSDIIQMLMRG